jgi:hypothetical protein
MLKPSTISAWIFWGALVMGAAACSPAPLPAPVSQADAVSRSRSAADAETFAPQAHAAAEKLRAEAKWLHAEGRFEEAAAAGEQAIAAYNEAFALARAARAEERIQAAEARREGEARELGKLDQMQSEIAAEADEFEMRARVELDKEKPSDVDQLTPDRAAARRTAAKHLAAEARLLCLSAEVLNKEAVGLSEAKSTTAQVEKDLSVGSIAKDLYPRSAAARAKCLETLTHTRRAKVKNAPQSSASDRLLTALTETGQLFAFRDDRGVVVNIGKPMTEKGELSDSAQNLLKLLAGVAKAHSNFPLLVVAHTARSGQESEADTMLAAVNNALTSAGAKIASSDRVLGAQPVVAASLRGAAEKNERLEVVFVIPGR